MPDYKGIDYLRKKLSVKQIRVLARYTYYDMKNAAADLSSIIPDKFKSLMPVLGWCAKAADSISDRIVFEGFDDDTLNMGEIYSLNNADVLTDTAVSSAVIASCSFIYISQGEDGYPRLQAIDGANATGIIDPVTHMLIEGYAVLERDEMSNALTEAYFNADVTQIYRAGKPAESYDNPTDYALLVPVINRPGITRPFGRSRISRACMELTNSAIRTLRRSEVSAEFYSFPQKYLLGLDPDTQMPDKWQATISSFLRFDKDEDGNHPVLGQFQQQSMTPYNEQLKTIASMFAGETGLTLDDLGFSTANPSTPDAIRASHETLRLIARKSQRDISVGLLNAGYLAACLRDNYAYNRSMIAQTKVLYEPLFEPDAAQLSGMGDAINKIQQSFPDYFDEEKLHRMTGL